jgi:hypothetical protein
VALTIGARVMCDREFSAFLNHSQMISPSNEDSEHTSGNVSTIERTTLRRNASSMSHSIPPLAYCKKLSTWSQSKPLLSSEVGRLVIRDLDGLVPQMSRNFNPTKLENCKLKLNAPPGVSPYLPESAWAKLHTTAKEDEKQKSESEPAASELHGGDVNDKAREPCQPCGLSITAVNAKAAEVRGYCECCNVSYVGSLANHCQTILHRSFMDNGANFVDFDAFVARFRSGLPNRYQPIESVRSPTNTEESYHPHSSSTPQTQLLESSVNEASTLDNFVSKKAKSKWTAPPVKRQLHQEDVQVDVKKMCKVDNGNTPSLNIHGSRWHDLEETSCYGNASLSNKEEGKSIGKMVLKTNREGKSIAGAVTGCDVVGGRSVYAVVYTDGDMEEMSSEEITQNIKQQPVEKVVSQTKKNIMFQTAKSLLSDDKSQA